MFKSAAREMQAKIAHIDSKQQLAEAQVCTLLDIVYGMVELLGLQVTHVEAEYKVTRAPVPGHTKRAREKGVWFSADGTTSIE